MFGCSRICVYMCVCCLNCVSFCSSVFSSLCTTNTYCLGDKHDNKEKTNGISMGNSPQHRVSESHFRKNRSLFTVDELAQPFLCSHHLTILSRWATQPASRWLSAVWVQYSLLTCSHCALQNTLATMPANLWRSLIASYYPVQTGFMFTCYFLALLQIWVLRESLRASFRRRSCCHLWMQLIRITFAFKYSIFGMIIRPKGYVILSDKLDSKGCLLSPQTGAG